MKPTRRPSKKPDWQIEIAKERIQILFDLAKREFKNNPNYSNRYVELARKIGMRYNVIIPKDLKRLFCKKCYSYLVPGFNSIHRTNRNQQSMEVRCKNCNNMMRFPYRKEKANKYIVPAKTKWNIAGTYSK